MQTMAASLDTETILRWLHDCARVYAGHKDELTALDSAIGDGDHGANMARGFTAVDAKLESLRGRDIGAVFKAVAMTLISTVGGASGPLYGTFFLRAAEKTAGKTTLEPQDLYAAFQHGLEGLMARGKAQVGEKTMVDALVPAVEALKPLDNDTLSAALDRAVEAVKKGAESAVPLVATKGRASYLGERSANHADPGCASSVLLLETLREAARAAG
jgi:dihydroxyacetone kinase-like protein